MSARCRVILVGAAVLVCLLSVVGRASLNAAPSAAGGSGLASADSRQSMVEAKRWIAQGDYAKALAALRPFAVNPVKYPRHHSDYIVVLFWSGDAGQAIHLYETMPASIPRKDYLKRNIAKAYYDTGSYQKAIDLYGAVLDSTPDDTVALQGLIQSMIAAGRVHEAIDRLDRFPEDARMPLDLKLLRADLLIDLGRYKESLDAYDRLMGKFDSDADAIAQRRDDRFAALDTLQRGQAIDQLKTATASGNPVAAGQQVLLRALFRDYAPAVAIYRQYGLDPSRLPPSTAYWAGWAFFKVGMPEKAMTIFNSILARNPDYRRAGIGLAYCLADSGQIPAARSRLDTLAQQIPDDLELLYAMAYVREKEKRFLDAIDIYDRMLAISPGNPTVERLRIRAFSDMGASTYASDQAGTALPDDRDLASVLDADIAADRIRWDEATVASKILDAIPVDPNSTRAQYDRIVALNRDDRHREAVARYESLPFQDREIPAYVLGAAAGSYLDLEKPDAALKLYDRALFQDPGSFSLRMGKFNALSDLRRWKDAKSLIDELDRTVPETVGHGTSRRYNPQKLEIAIARGWFLIQENRLAEADAYFQNLRQQAPANLEVRSALAHIYLWRGWPRRSLEAFDIIHSMDPEYLPAKTGRLAAMNTLAVKQEAREQAQALLKQHPRKKWVQRLVRQFDVEQMDENRFDVAASRDEDGITDIFLQDTVSTPLSLYTRLYGFMLWRRTWNDDPDQEAIALGDDQPTYFKRIGAGVNHIFNSDWAATQQFSVNYNDGQDFGSLTRVEWTPDDHWRVSGLVDTFDTDVAKRARAAGVTAKRISAGIGYRQSEWREANMSVSRQFYSDDNERDQILLGYQQNLMVKNDWRMRIFIDLYGMRNSLWDSPDIVYYNPKSAWSLSLTHMTEQTVRKLGDRSFVHRLFLTVGNYDQYAYSNGPIGAVRYEQAYEFSDTNALSWGVSLGSNRYDGDNVAGISVDAVWRVRF